MLQRCAFDLRDIPIEDDERWPGPGIPCERAIDNTRAIILFSGLRRAVDDGKNCIAIRWEFHRLPVVEQLVLRKKRDAGPIDEFSQILLLPNERVTVCLQML